MEKLTLVVKKLYLIVKNVKIEIIVYLVLKDINILQKI